jgi:hypothetical protein
MNTITRMLAMTGISLFASVSLGAGPAMASTGSDSGSAKTTVASRYNDRDRVVDFFDTRRECEYVGDRGESWGRWDDFDCVRVNGDWALLAEDDDDDWGQRWPGLGWPGGWPGHHRSWPTRSPWWPSHFGQGGFGGNWGHHGHHGPRGPRGPRF